MPTLSTLSLHEFPMILYIQKQPKKGIKTGIGKVKTEKKRKEKKTRGTVAPSNAQIHYREDEETNTRTGKRTYKESPVSNLRYI